MITEHFITLKIVALSALLPYPDHILFHFSMLLFFLAISLHLQLYILDPGGTAPAGCCILPLPELVIFRLVRNMQRCSFSFLFHAQLKWGPKGLGLGLLTKLSIPRTPTTPGLSIRPHLLSHRACHLQGLVYRPVNTHY